MGVFTGCQLGLELSTSVPFKKKQELRKKITENDGVVSFIITKKVHNDILLYMEPTCTCVHHMSSLDTVELCIQDTDLYMSRSI